MKEKALELIGKMPNDYVAAEIRECVKKLPGPKGIGTGYGVPLNIFLSQEIARMQHVFSIVSKTLHDTCDAIDGQIIMTP